MPLWLNRRITSFTQTVGMLGVWMSLVGCLSLPAVSPSPNSSPTLPIQVSASPLTHSSAIADESSANSTPLALLKASSTMSSLQTLHTICDQLSTDPRPLAAEIASSIGTIVDDSDGDLPITVQPSDATFRTGQIVRQVGTDYTAHVKLVVAESTPLLIAMLQAEFGDYTEIPQRDLDRAPRIIFYVASPISAASCAVIAEVNPDAVNVADGNATVIILRRN